LSHNTKGGYNMAQKTVRYICPICDHEMMAGTHICWNCKRYIRDPWIYTGDHLPNEDHGDCHPMESFLRPREGMAGTRETAGKKKSHQGQKPGRQPIYDQSKINTGNGQKKGKSGSGAGTLILVLIVFWYIIRLILSL
jgi:hypothetical protein